MKIRTEAMTAAKKNRVNPVRFVAGVAAAAALGAAAAGAITPTASASTYPHVRRAS